MSLGLIVLIILIVLLLGGGTYLGPGPGYYGGYGLGGLLLLVLVILLLTGRLRPRSPRASSTAFKALAYLWRRMTSDPASTLRSAK